LRQRSGPAHNKQPTFKEGRRPAVLTLAQLQVYHSWLCVAAQRSAHRQRSHLPAARHQYGSCHHKGNCRQPLVRVQVANVAAVQADKFKRKPDRWINQQVRTNQIAALRSTLPVPAQPQQQEGAGNVEDRLVQEERMECLERRVGWQTVLEADADGPRQLAGRTVQFLIDIVAPAANALRQQQPATARSPHTTKDCACRRANIHNASAPPATPPGIPRPPSHTYMMRIGF